MSRKWKKARSNKWIKIIFKFYISQTVFENNAEALTQNHGKGSYENFPWKFLLNDKIS